MKNYEYGHKHCNAEKLDHRLGIGIIIGMIIIGLLFGIVWDAIQSIGAGPKKPLATLAVPAKATNRVLSYQAAVNESCVDNGGLKNIREYSYISSYEIVAECFDESKVVYQGNYK